MSVIYRQKPLHEIGISSISGIRNDVAPGLKRAFVDVAALRGLSQLISGPISSWEQLKAAELAIRAFVFHDDVHFAIPYAQRQLVNSPDGKVEGYQSGRGNIEGDVMGGVSPPENSSFPNLSPLIQGSQTHSYQITADARLYEFPDKQYADRYVPSFNSTVEKAVEQRKADTEGMNLDISIDFVHEKLTYVSDGWESYYQNEFHNNSELTKRFIGQIALTGSPIYVASASYSDQLDAYAWNKGGVFFEQLDLTWNQLTESWARVGLNIAIDPMLLIVLTRARSREDICSVVLDIREEFSAARSQLWGLFDELALEGDLIIQERILSGIEAAAKDIIPSAFRTNNFWLPLRFGSGFFKALSSWMESSEGLGASVAETLRNTGKINYVDAARILASELSQSNTVLTVLTKHLNETELTALMGGKQRHLDMMLGKQFLDD